LSQAVNTFWDDVVDRTGVGVRVRPAMRTAVKVRPAVKQGIRAHRFLDAIVLMIIIAASAMCVSKYQHARAELNGALSKHAAAEEKLQDLTISVERIERDVQRLRTDPRFIEHFARQKFGFVRSGEVVIKVPEDQKEPASTASAARPIRVANLTVQSSDSYANPSN
jgi:cell division protein FtsB